jgi:hypothetical protein
MRTTKVVQKYLFTLLLIVCCTCTTTHRLTSADDIQFYSEHSKKLGVQLQGNEPKEIIRTSAQWLGTPYKYGGNSRSGIDCSAFVGTVYKNALDITLPRSSSAIAKSLNSVNRNHLQCGDVVFFTNKEKRVSHVGIYLSDNKFVHASSSGGVSVSSLDNSYWSTFYAGAGRVKGSNAPLKPIESKPAESVSKGSWAANRKAKNADSKNTPSVISVESTPTTSAESTEKVATDSGLIIIFDSDF